MVPALAARPGDRVPPIHLNGPIAAYLGLGLGAAAAVTLLEGQLGTGPLTSAFPLVATLAVWLGVMRPGAARRWPWFAVAAGLLAFGLGTALLTSMPGERSLLPLPAELVYALGYPFLFLGAIALASGTHRGDRTLYIDAAIIGLAAGVLLWVALVEPASRLVGLPPGAELFLIADVALLAIALPLPLIRESRSVPGVLLVGGLALLTIGDVWWGLVAYAAGGGPATPAGIDRLATLVWLTGFVLLGAACLHPSAPDLGISKAASPAVRDPIRIVAVSLAVLVLPGVIVIQGLLHVTELGRTTTVLGLASFVLAMLVVYRIRRAIGDVVAADARFRRFMDREGVIAAIKDHHGRYTYLNRQAIELTGVDPEGWLGKTDAELFPPDVASWYSHHDEEVRSTGVPRVTGHRIAGRHWHAEKFRIPWNGGLVGVLQLDITDRVEAEQALRKRESLLARAEATAHIGSWEWDPETGEVMCSDELYRILGLEIGSPLTRDRFVTFIHPDDRRRLAGSVHSKLDSGALANIEFRIIRQADGEVRRVHLTGSSESSGDHRRFVGILEDVTEQREKDRRIRMLDAAMAEATDGVLVTDRDGRTLYANAAFREATGPNPSLPASLGTAIDGVARTGMPWLGDTTTRRADGREIICATSISPLHGEDGEVIGHLTIQRDVTRKRAEEAATARRARERALIAEMLGRLRAGRSPEETATEICHQVAKVPEVAMVTLIAFDEQRLATIIGQVNRLGTERIGIRLSEERSAYLHERASVGPWVERWVSNPAHPYDGMIQELGIVGHAYANLRNGDEPLGLLIVGSDAAGATAHLTEQLPALAEFAAIAGTLLAEPLEARMARARVEAAIHRTIDESAFATVFQPIVELAGGAIQGYEALTRFEDGRAPDEWFAEAHAVGLGVELEAACVRGAVEAALRLPDGAWLNVNVSPTLVMSGRLDGLLPQLPRTIVLEVTEHDAVTDYVAFRQAVAQLGDRVRLAVDDAGAGFASLRHIVELEPWLVKLDRSLIANIDADAARQAIVAGMAHFADAVGIVLLGEGIETDAELETLRSLSISLGQGFLIGRPACAA